MLFIRPRQCSMCSRKLSDSCLSWTQRRQHMTQSCTTKTNLYLSYIPYLVSSLRLNSCVVIHSVLHHGDNEHFYTLSTCNNVEHLMEWDGAKRGLREDLPGLLWPRGDPTLHRWFWGDAAAGCSRSSGTGGGCCSTASGCRRGQHQTKTVTSRLVSRACHYTVQGICWTTFETGWLTMWNNMYYR